MGSSKPVSILHPVIEKLKADIALQEETVAMLRKNGHIYRDAELYLNQLKERLAHLQ